ncbi:MAG: hypothetical protein QOH25_21 [Acidobacteriota bacterium]|jgi:hypothetical protein|nr:hypothetical protein [Acidobacteriota bacterium]
MMYLAKIVGCVLLAGLVFSHAQAQAQTQPTPTPEPSSAASVESNKTAAPDSSDSKATIYFYRIKQFAGAALEPGVYVDDKEVASMDNGRFFGVTLEPGKHTFRMGDKQTGFEIDMKAGQVYYARVSIEMGFWKGHGRLTLLQPEQGAFEIKKVKPLGISKVKNRALVTIYEGSDKTQLSDNKTN